MSIITLTTDFGTSDHYVAAMKGVLLTVTPHATLVDITHAIRPQDVVHAAFVFRHAFPYFPEGTVHVVVVDPGVGTSRRLLAARYAGQTVLAPDNGILSMVHHDFPLEALHEVANRRWFIQDQSATFHGRDILAPVAGHLACGDPLEEVGPQTDHLEILNLADPGGEPGGPLRGFILHIDHFGNLVTNIRQSDVAGYRAGLKDAASGRAREPLVFVGETGVGPLRRTYADVAEGELLALIGSADLLEIAVNSGSAAARLRALPGEAVFVQ